MGLDDILGVVAVCGDEGTGKTTMALTFPKHLRHFDIDVGGYRRAAWRLPADGIVTKSYPKPIQLEKLMGQKVEASSRKVIFPKKVTGMNELWQAVVIDFVEACQDTSVKTTVLDSATQLWNICHKGVLQELQERQLAKHMKFSKGNPFDENDYRERLQPVEYGPANDKMRTLIHTARSFGKNLVLTHYPTDEYGTISDSKGNMVEGKTGKIILDGFKETSKLADLIVWTSIKEVAKQEAAKEKFPVAKITKCGIEGMGLAAVGMEITATYEDFINMKNMMQSATSV